MADTFTFTIKPITDLSDVKANVGEIQKAFSKLKLPDKLGEGLNKNIKSFFTEFEKYESKVKEGIKTSGDYRQAESSLNKINSLYSEIVKDIQTISKGDLSDVFDLDSGEFKVVGDQIKEIVKQLDNIKIDPNKITGPIEQLRSLIKNDKVSGKTGILNNLIGHVEKGELDEAKAALSDLEKYIKKVSLPEGQTERIVGKMTRSHSDAAREALTVIQQVFAEAQNKGLPLEQTLDTLRQRFQDVQNSSANSLRDFTTQAGESVEATESLVGALQKAHKEDFNFDNQVKSIDRQIQSYFGLGQMIHKVGNIARDAFGTIQELDKAMTETAVVTNFDVGDMWEKLPLYTAQANKLGSSIKDVYEATTLYYQQGLNTTQSMGLAVETLKMARIANMSAKDATDAMTAALRGFNLELNQTSAQRINDVYSELAAITASDTQEISTAMEKVASLAHNAGMEVETTSAFLAQMIETTREAPENLGTALKTVVARFQEMKQDPTKLIDSEGVMLDANKVDKALKSIGVNLLDTNGQFRKLDDVFLEIASKWDTMSMGQQRYIATMAAGSRQQSRFIAMMSNYSRTMELVDAAYNSSGASQRQFEKTLESLDAKLNKLRNAWNQFTMGLMNDELLKGGIDLLTIFIDKINDLVDFIGNIPPDPFKGITKSLTTLILTLGGLGAARKVLSRGIESGVGWFRGDMNGKQAIANLFFSPKNALTEAKAEKEAATKAGKEAGSAFSIAYANARDNILKNKPFIPTLAKNGEILNYKQVASMVGEGTEQQQEALRQYQREEISKEDFAKQVGLSLNKDGDFVKGAEISTTKIAQFSQGVQSAGVALQSFGNILQGTPLAPFGKLVSTTGMLLSNFGGLVAKAATTAAVGVTTASGATVTGIRAIGLAILQSPLTPWILGLMALVAVGKLIYNELTREKREMEALAEAAKTSSDAFDNLKTATETLKNSIEELRNSDSLFDGLVVGTTEWNLALVEANQQVLDLIKKYPMLQKYMTTDANGRMSISEAGFKAVQDEQNKLLGQAQALDIYNNALHNAALERQEQDKLLKDEGVTKTKAKTVKHGRDSYTITEEQADEINYNALSDEGKREWESIEARIKAESEAANKQAIRAALSTSGELNDTVLNLFSQNFEDAQKAFKGETDMSVMKQAYADFIGGVFDSATGTITDLSGEEVDIDKEAIQKIYPQIMALLHFQDQAPQVESAVKSLGQSFNSLFENKEGSTFINDLLDNNLEADAFAINKFLDMSDTEIEKVLENISDEEVKAIMQSDTAQKSDLINLLKTNADNLRQAQTQSYKDAAVWYAKSVKKWNADTAKNQSTYLANQMKKMSVGSADAINNFMNQMSQSFDSAALSTMGESLFDALLGQTDVVQQKLAGIINNVDWSSAIERGRFYEEFEEGTDAFKELNAEGQKFIKTTKQVDKGLDLTGKQFEELVQSSDFLEILTEKWSDFADDSGKIDASGVREMAKECGTLGKLLDLDEFKAENLATALNYFQQTGSFDGINSATLAAMQHFDALGNLVGQVKKDIDDFDEGQDYSEGIETYRSRMEELQKMFESGQYSNEKTLNLAKNLFGVDQFQNLVNEYGSNKAAEAHLMDAAPLLAENLQDTALMALESMANGVNIFGETINDEIDDRLKVAFNADDIDLQIGDMTQEEVVAEMAKRLDVSEELARGILEGLVGQDWGLVGDNLALDLKRNGRLKGLQEFAKTQDTTRGFNTDNGQMAISQSVFDTLLETGGYLDEIGTTYKDRAAAENALKEQMITAFTDSTNRTVEAINVFDNTAETLDGYLQAKYGKAVSVESAAMQLLNVDAKKGIGDFTAAIQQLQADGYNYQQATELIYNQAKDLNLQKLLVDGKEVNLEDILNVTEFNDAIDNLEEASHWEDVGTIIANTIADILHEAGIGNGSNNDNTTTGNTTIAPIEAEAKLHIVENLEVKKEDAVKNLTYTQNEVKALEAQINDLKQADPTCDTSELEARLEEVKAKAQSFRDEIDIINTKLNNLANKTVNIHYSTSGSAVPSNLPTSVRAGIVYKGKNNYISTTGFYTGSAARGRYGTVGPKDRGGLTLTGEKGFEIAWLPSENRSMIVGATGPQMVNLPSDAVVYTHEQSKKIISQKSIPAGSHAKYDRSSYYYGGSGGSGSSSGSGSGSSSSSSSDKEKDPKRTNWYKEEITRYNLNQSINQITAQIEKTTKSIEKSLDKLGTKYSDIAKDVDTQAKLINQNISNQKALQKSYQDQINLLTNGGRSLWIDITDSAGNSSQKSISTSQFISKQSDGSYYVNRDKVMSYAAGLGGDYELQKVNAESIFNTIQGELSNLTSGLLNATKAIQDGEDELQQLIQQVADAFYAWENELTKIYDLNQQLELSDSRRGRLAAENSMLLAQIEAGFSSAAKAADRLIQIQKDDATLIKDRIQLLKDDIKAKQDQLKLLAESSDEESDWAKYNYNNQQKVNNGGTISIEEQALEKVARDNLIAARAIEAYVKITRNQDGTYSFDLNEDLIESERLSGRLNEQTYNAVKEGFDKLVETNEDLQQSIIDASDLMTELYEEYNDHIKTLADLENDLIKAFEETAKMEVSKLEALNSSLTATAKAIVEQVKKNLDARRKAEDNAKTESDIAKKQQRLNALRANTDGGNAVEIAQLEKEIGDAQKSYGRTLEDQMLSQMQTQADEASKQRQEQIDLAKQQIEYNKQAGVYAEMADYLLDNINKESDAIATTLNSTADLGTGKWQQLVDDLEIQNQVAEALRAATGVKELEDILGDNILSANGQTTNAINTIGGELIQIISGANGVMLNTKEQVSSGTGGAKTITAPEVTQNAAPKTSSSSSSSKSSSTPKAKDYSSGWLATLPETNSNYFSASQVQTLQHGLNTMKWSGLISFGADLAIDGIIGPKTTTAIKALQKLVGTTQDGIWGPQTGSATHKKYPKYARGGLANKTGPAWLDGTPTKPELVLNAQDTKNFIALKDILSGVMRSISHTDTSNIYNSPTNFEINVNVDKISSDYDVDKLTERIKRNIVKDATYRNVTAVRNFR